MTENRKLESIQALRSILFIGVAAFHCEISEWGVMCITVFFVLSGFVLAYRYFDCTDMKTDRSFRLAFALNHIDRLYLLHILMLLLCIAINIIGSEGFFISFMRLCYNDIDKLIPNILLVQSWYPTEEYYFAFNGVSWFLSTILFCYFMFPSAFNLIRKHSKHVCRIIVILISAEILLAAAGSIINVGFFSDELFGKWAAYIFPPYRLLDFMIGMCMGFIYCGRKHTKKRSVYSTAEVSVLIISAVEIILYKISEGSVVLEPFRCSLYFIGSSIAIVYLCAVNRGIISTSIACRPLIFLGNLSGYAFMIHLMVLRCVLRFAGNLNEWLLFIAVLIITFCLSCFYSKALKRMRALRR